MRLWWPPDNFVALCVDNFTCLSRFCFGPTALLDEVGFSLYFVFLIIIADYNTDEGLQQTLQISNQNGEGVDDSRTSSMCKTARKFSQEVSRRKSSIKALGGGTCSCSKICFQALFSQSLIFAWRGHFQELQLNNDLIYFSKIWPDARIICNQQKRVGKFDNSKSSFLESHFRAFTPHGFLAVLKMFCNF